MKKYFYLNNGQKVGPFTYDELWNQKISPATMVWSEGMPDWQRANTIQEFANWFPKQPVAQKRYQQPLQKPQHPSRPIQRKPVKRKKSYRGIIGISFFLIIAVFIAYLYYEKSEGNSNSTPYQDLTINENSNSNATNKANNKISIIKQSSSNKTSSVDNFSLNPNSIGNEIAFFLGSVRTSFSQAKLLFMTPYAEDKFQFIIDTYSENSVKMFFQGVIPSIKYQSLSSTLIIFYNPWNDLVLVTEWELFGNEILIVDMELLTADFIQYDGLDNSQLDPVWYRNLNQMPIEALTEQTRKREKLFNETWGELTGNNSWRKVMNSLSSIVLLIENQQIVAYRLLEQHLSMSYLLNVEEIKALKEPFINDMRKLHSPNAIQSLLQEAPNTPDIVLENMSKFPENTWDKSSLQAFRKVSDGAFLFVTSPKLTKNFLSFYYKFTPDNKFKLDRIDWCTFDNEL